MKTAGENVYSPQFYAKHQGGARQSAGVIVPLILELIHPRSVIDIGCGVGTWLSVFKANGVDDIFGVDGPWVRRDRLEIPRDQFKSHDLTQPFDMSRQFDLVMSLEVAEHLPAESAATFVDSLTGMGPVILFSAAIPFQGGAHHVNEQWPDYWAALFARKGYRVIDAIRPRVWQNPSVEWFYAQNALLLARDDYLRSCPSLVKELTGNRALPLALVHPARFIEASQFMQRLAQTAADISRLVSAGQPFILVDTEQLRPMITAGSRSLPFLERDGAYWGPPADDDAAIAELDRLRHGGATFIIFAWPAFWWLDHYAAFGRHLRTRFVCAAENERIVAFDLRTQKPI